MKACVLVGPTAAGKTAFSLELGGFGFEIISFDSVQVYKYLDIGSGKPSREERSAVPHYCIDLVDPDFAFTSADFIACALKSVERIKENGKFPLFVGGTGLYIDALMKGLSPVPPADHEIRVKLLSELEEKGIDFLYNELCECDPVHSMKISPADKQRVLRGLEVYRSSGKPLSSYYSERKGYGSEDTLYLGLYEEKTKLREIIEKRLDVMLEKGFVEEVRSIRSMGYTSDLKSMRSIGYSEVNKYIDGKLSFPEMHSEIILNTRRYAKRQMTWFRKNELIQWFSNDQKKAAVELIKSWLSKHDR